MISISTFVIRELQSPLLLCYFAFLLDPLGVQLRLDPLVLLLLRQLVDLLLLQLHLLVSKAGWGKIYESWCQCCRLLSVSAGDWPRY